MLTRCFFFSFRHAYKPKRFISFFFPPLLQGAAQRVKPPFYYYCYYYYIKDQTFYTPTAFMRGRVMCIIIYRHRTVSSHQTSTGARCVGFEANAIVLPESARISAAALRAFGGKIQDWAKKSTFVSQVSSQKATSVKG